MTWRFLGRLQDGEHLVSFHEALCRILETAICYDQLDCPALASMELVCRQIQSIEERLKHKFTDAGGGDSFEQSLIAGYQSRGSLCICPALSEWIAEEIRKNTAVEKERRKARDERSLQKPPKKE